MKICIVENQKKFAMLIYNKELSVCPITTHVPLKYVAKSITKNSKVNLIKIENETDLRNLIRQTGYGEKIYIGMGAGTISSWMKNLSTL